MVTTSGFSAYQLKRDNPSDRSICALLHKKFVSLSVRGMIQKPDEIGRLMFLLTHAHPNLLGNFKNFSVNICISRRVHDVSPLHNVDLLGQEENSYKVREGISTVGHNSTANLGVMGYGQPQFFDKVEDEKCVTERKDEEGGWGGN